MIKKKGILILVGGICLSLLLVFVGACAPPEVAPPPEEEEKPPPPAEEEESPPPPAEKITLTFSHAESGDNACKLVTDRIVERLQEAVADWFDIKAYGINELFTYGELAPALTAGNLHMSMFGDHMLTGLETAFALPQGLFLFNNQKSRTEIYKSAAGKKLIEKFASEHGIRILGVLPKATSGQIFNRVGSLRIPDDFKGLRFRAPPSKAVVELAKASGASAIQLAPAEVVTALSTGMVDGIYSGFDFVIPYYDGINTVPYCTLAVGGMTGSPRFLVMVSEQWWGSLSPELQQDIRNVLSEEFLEEMGEVYWERYFQFYIQFRDAPGTHMDYITGDELKLWEELSEPLNLQIVEEAGPLGQELYEEILRLQKLYPEPEEGMF